MDPERKLLVVGSRYAKRTPRNAVVAIKIEDSNSYVDILKKAREKINIKEMEISNLKFRKSANGGILLEIPCPDGHARAETLANCLKEEVGSQAKILRPSLVSYISVA